MLERIKQLLKFQQFSKVTVFEKIENIFLELGGDTLTIKIGDDLIPFGNDICCMTDKIRNELSDVTGFILPPVRIVNDENIQENEYVLQIFNHEILNGFAIPNKNGIDEISLKFKEIILDNIDKILTNEITEKYIDTVQKKNSRLIYSLSYKISSPEIQIILADILKSGHSIRNISYIFEKIGNKVLLNDNYCKPNPHKISEEIISEL